MNECGFLFINFYYDILDLNFTSIIELPPFKRGRKYLLKRISIDNLENTRPAKLFKVTKKSRNVRYFKIYFELDLRNKDRMLYDI